MKLNIKIIALLFLLSLGQLSIAEEKSKSYQTKLGSNALSFILIGDINGFFEKQISKRVSIVSTAHYITSEPFQESETDFRGSLGIRSYGFKNQNNYPPNKTNENTSLTGSFFEFKTGLIRINGKPKSSIEFGGGKSYLFNENLYYEWKLGLSRLIGDTTQEGSPVTLTAAFGIGFLM